MRVYDLDIQDEKVRLLMRIVELMHKHPVPLAYEFDESHESGIGPTYTMKCQVCGEEWDITNYENW